jgi:uroporphyrinogen III methyltransferase / synthase
VTVYLVGAGPGDPGLLTVRGAELLARADVVIYDRLSVVDLLRQAPPGVELVSVGKTPGGPTVPQERINDLLVEYGRTHSTVVRLKGGDPFVFARGGEEAFVLIEAGIDFEVVPGITSAIAAPAAAGIPVTLRYSSTSFTVITGHEDPSKGTSIDWEVAARLGGTIVILMGVGRWNAISQALMRGGLSADTPAAAIRWGTRPEQQTIRATLGTLGDHALASPSTIVVGEVAAVDVGWLERLPLFGQRVLVTRGRRQASALSQALRRLGAAPVEVPTIEIIEAPDGGAALAAAAASIDSYDWVVLTSPNGVERLFASLRDARALGAARVAVIGRGTARALRRFNIEADLVPERSVGEGLLDVFPQPPARGGRVLLARAADARDALPEGLVGAGWSVDDVAAYRTVPVEPDPADCEAAASADIATFTSSSTVRSFVAAYGADACPEKLVSIGPVTTATALELGLHVDAEADPHDIDGLVAAVLDLVEEA